MEPSAHSEKSPTQRIGLGNLAATAKLGESLARCLKRGDLILLYGDLGAGKTTLARALINAAQRTAGEKMEDVPSPTFTLVQNYNAGSLMITHADLYRLENSADTAELGLEDALDDGVVIVEWPDRLSHPLSPDRLEIYLSGMDDKRVAEMIAYGRWQSRLAQIKSSA